jgi:hypothetical protein
LEPADLGNIIAVATTPLIIVEDKINHPHHTIRDLCKGGEAIIVGVKGFAVFPYNRQPFIEPSSPTEGGLK